MKVSIQLSICIKHLAIVHSYCTNDVSLIVHAPLVPSVTNHHFPKRKSKHVAKLKWILFITC